MTGTTHARTHARTYACTHQVRNGSGLQVYTILKRIDALDVPWRDEFIEEMQDLATDRLFQHRLIFAQAMLPQRTQCCGLRCWQEGRAAASAECDCCRVACNLGVA